MIERELESLVGAEVAVRRVFRRLHERFMALKGPTLQQRADDVADLGRRVLRHLRGVDGSSLEHVPAGNVLVVERLLPSDVVPLSRRGVAAIVVGALASGAHAAMLAREKRTPWSRVRRGSCAASGTWRSCSSTARAAASWCRRMRRPAARS